MFELKKLQSGFKSPLHLVVRKRNLLMSDQSAVAPKADELTEYELMALADVPLGLNNSNDLALFDFDGTLTNCDTFTPFIKKVISPARLFWGRLALLPVIAAYRIGLVSSSQMRRLLVKLSLTGRSKMELEQLGLQHATEFLPTMIRPLAMKKLQWHLAAGDRVVLVSASLDLYLKPWCDQMGIELLSASLEAEGDRLTGYYKGLDCCGAEKANRVKALLKLSHFDRIYAYGDTKEDRELLALADEKYYQWKRM
jgi:phosphatidylglycerophosphatase C